MYWLLSFAVIAEKVSVSDDLINIEIETKFQRPSLTKVNLHSSGTNPYAPWRSSKERLETPVEFSYKSSICFSAFWYIYYQGDIGNMEAVTAEPVKARKHFLDLDITNILLNARTRMVSTSNRST